MRFGIDLDMRRKLRFLDLRRNGRDDHRWTEPVANVILYDQDGSYTALFRTYNRRQIRKKHIPSFDDQGLHPAY